MKRLNPSFFPLFILLSFSFLLHSCFGDLFENPEPELPPFTCEGKGKFGCLLNGELFLHDGFMHLLMAEYNIEDRQYDGTFKLKATRSASSIRVTLIKQVLGTGLYPLGHDNDSTGSATYTYFNNTYEEYRCYSGMYGEMNITGIDTANSIICGTFAFDAVNTKNNQDTVRIRDARFDAKFSH